MPFSAVPSGLWRASGWPTPGKKTNPDSSSLLFLVSTLGSAVAWGVADFSIWRFVGGMGVGLASTVSPMYIAEVAPARLRGRLVVVNQLAIVIGLSLSVFVTYLLAFGGHWRWMFATQAVPVFCLMAGLVFVPESPRWLAMVGNHARALRVLVKINGVAQAERELREIRAELGAETGGFGELFRPGVRLAVAIGIALMVFSQINGVNMILLYTPTLFLEAGITTAPDAILNSVYIDGWITLCTVIAFWLIRKFSRRSILIGGTIAMAAGHLLMFASFTYALPSIFTLAAMLVPTGAFTLTLAPPELGGAFGDISQPHSRQGNVIGHLRDVCLLLRDRERVSDGVGRVQGSVWTSGRHFPDLPGHLSDVLSVCMAGGAGDQRQNLGRNRRVLVTEGPRKDCVMKSMISMPFFGKP